MHGMKAKNSTVTMHGMEAQNSKVLLHGMLGVDGAPGTNGESMAAARCTTCRSCGTLACADGPQKEVFAVGDGYIKELEAVRALEKRKLERGVLQRLTALFSFPLLHRRPM